MEALFRSKIGLLDRSDIVHCDFGQRHGGIGKPEIHI